MEILDDLPRILFLLSFVLIGLFRWIANTIAERRKATDEGKSEETQEPVEDWRPPVSAPSKPAQPTRQAPPALPDALRDFFDTVTNPETPPQETRSSPPPTPPLLPSLNKAEHDALAAIKKGTNTSPVSARRQRTNKRQFGDLFSDPASLKRAFVMKEILDEPKSLKSPGTLGSF